MINRKASFFVREIPVYGELILAPMDGFSDLPFRSICRRFGSAMSYTAFVGAIELLGGHEHSWGQLRYLPEERPVVF
jgi:tRNA-dihydrouridine synthase B